MSESSASSAISELHPALAGHFPGNPVVPGVVILDHVCRALTRDYGVRVKALPAVKFHAPLQPAEVFAIELSPAGSDRYRFRVVRGATLIAAGTIATQRVCARPKAD
jgi:3-hydroxymyristoyl/3-hydroxydecanoyl-(acyl carrier protein) dehydratase